MRVFSHTQNPSVSSEPHSPEVHATGVSDRGQWSTKRIAVYALLTALAMATSFLEIPLFPAAPWLKYDPSGIVCLIAGLAYGPTAAAVVSTIGFAPHLFADPWGSLMAMGVALALSVPAAIVHRRKRTHASAALGIGVGAVCALAAAIVGNLLVTPLYAAMTMKQVASLILPVLLPFNLLKFAIHATVTLLAYRPVTALLDR